LLKRIGKTPSNFFKNVSLVIEAKNIVNPLNAAALTLKKIKKK
jgi:hypothetical protein